MATGTKAIKSKIRAIERTGQVTKAMEAVSAVKMRKTQANALAARAYAKHALSILKRVSGSMDKSQSEYMAERTGNKVCFLVVTSDKGLAGNYNSAVLQRVKRYMEKEEIKNEDARIFAIGRRGADYFSKRGFVLEARYERFEDFFAPERLREITDNILHLFKDKEVDRCMAMYTNFKTTLEQEVVVRQLLPISYNDIAEIVRGIVPDRGKFADQGEEDEDKKVARVYTFEPDAETVLRGLVPFLMNIGVYHAVLEAKASEHSARMVAMKNATDRSFEIKKELTQKYNKARQAAITRELSEISGSIEAAR